MDEGRKKGIIHAPVEAEGSAKGLRETDKHDLGHCTERDGRRSLLLLVILFILCYYSQILHRLSAVSSVSFPSSQCFPRVPVSLLADHARLEGTILSRTDRQTASSKRATGGRSMAFQSLSSSVPSV